MDIKPTVGRVVYFRPAPVHDDAPLPPEFVVIDAGQPCRADIVYVHNDRLVNLKVEDHEGNTFRMKEVALRQPDDPVIEGHHCEWMPFQRGQTEKAQAPGGIADLEKRVNALEAQRFGGTVISG